MPLSAPPPVGYGTYNISDADAETAVSAAIRAGFRHIDTAQGYRNEAGVGRGITASGVPRDDLFVTTKLWPGNPAWGMPLKTQAETVAAAEASVAALGIAAVDLYLIHAPFAFDGADIDAGLAQWRGCIQAKEKGIARSIGVSNFQIKHFEAIEAAGLEMPVYNELELHPLCQQRELLAFMASKNIAPIAYSSLAPLPSWRVLEDGTNQESGKHRMDKTRGAAMAKAIAEIAAGKGNMSEAQVLLRWGLQKGFAILPKSLQPARMAENLAVSEMTLAEDEMNRLDALGGDMDTPLAWAACGFIE